MPVRKKYNPHKRHKRIADIALKNLCLVWCNGNTEIWPYNYKTGNKMAVGNSVVNALDKIRHNWLVYFAIFMREKNGKTKTVFAEAPAPFECFHYQLIDSLNQQHKALIDSYSHLKDLICGVGWIAVPKDVCIDDEMLEQLLRANGAYSYLAPWQE